MSEAEIKLYLVEDCDLQSETFEGIFSDRFGIQFKRFANGEAIIRDGDFDSGPVVLLVDLFLPDTTGISLVNDLKTKYGEITFIAISGRLEIESIRELFNIGAYDVVEKGISIIQLLGIVQRATDKARSLWEIKLARQRVESILLSLSSRENEVLDSLLRGLSSKEIAFSMSISPRTVDVHRANILSKIGIPSLVILGSLLTDLGIFKPSFEEIIDSFTTRYEQVGN